MNSTAVLRPDGQIYPRQLTRIPATPLTDPKQGNLNTLKTIGVWTPCKLRYCCVGTGMAACVSLPEPFIIISMDTMTAFPESTASAPSLAADIRMVLFFILLFIGITLSLGAALALTSTTEPEVIMFPINNADGSVTLARLFCDLPK